MKFTKKLSLLLGATKAMQPTQNVNEHIKEDNVQAITEQEDTTINQTIPKTTTEERPPDDNGPKQVPSLWGKLKDSNENNKSSNEDNNMKSSKVEDENLIQTDIKSVEKASGNNEPLKKTSFWKRFKDADKPVKIGDQIGSKEGKNVIILEINYVIQIYIYWEIDYTCFSQHLPNHLVFVNIKNPK